jgi:hypothetical protein
VKNDFLYLVQTYVLCLLVERKIDSIDALYATSKALELIEDSLFENVCPPNPLFKRAKDFVDFFSAKKNDGEKIPEHLMWCVFPFSAQNTR